MVQEERAANQMLDEEDDQAPFEPKSFDCLRKVRHGMAWQNSGCAGLLPRMHLTYQLPSAYQMMLSGDSEKWQN